MVNTKIRLIIFFAAKDGESLYSQQKQDIEMTVHIADPACCINGIADPVHYASCLMLTLSALFAEPRAGKEGVKRLEEDSRSQEQ